MNLIFGLFIILKIHYIESASDEKSRTIPSYLGLIEKSNFSVEYVPYEKYTLPFITRDLDFLSAAVDRIKNEQCKEQCHEIISGLYNFTTWAAEFYDASGKLPEGILAGSTYQLGNFDECLGIGRNIKTPSEIKGQYCLATIKVNFENDARSEGKIWEKFGKVKNRYDEKVDEVYWGICIPDKCTHQDLKETVNAIIAKILPLTKFDVSTEITKDSCYREEIINPSKADIAYLVIILTITLIIVIGTLYHAICLKGTMESPKSIFSQVLVAFSVILSWKKLFGPAHEDLNIDCISGIKFFCMGFIIAGHTLIFVLGGPVLNSNFWQESIGKVENSIFLNNPLLVDTFLFLSGFLFCRILLQELDKRKSVNFLLLYIFRFIRLTPAYLVIVGLYVTWLPKLDSGPLWWRMKLENERCLASWWANILYINNYVNTDKICMFQSWYLSVDTQLFILAPIVIYPLWRWRKIGHYIIAAATIISTILPLIITWINNLDPTLLIYRREVKDISTNEYFKTNYIKTHMRASAYCFGLLYGYIVYRIQDSGIKMKKSTVILGWILGTLALVTSMCSINIFYVSKKNFSTPEAAFYSCVHRALWSIGTGWVLLACITDNSGPIRNFLKWRFFVPLSRLTYSAYLVNGLVEIHSVSTTRTPQHLDNFTLFGKVLSHLMLTFLGAVILSTMFESPILGLERILLQRDKKSSSSFSKKTDSEETSVTEA